MQNQLFNRTRLQLTSWYALVMGLILGVCGFVTYQVVINAYLSAIDQELKAVAETLYHGIELDLKQPSVFSSNVKQLLPDLCLTGESCLTPINERREDQVSTETHILSAVHQSDYYIQFLNISGQLIATSGLRPRELPLIRGSQLWQTVKDSQGNRYHQMSLELHTASKQSWGYLQVGRSLRDVDSRLSALKTTFFVGLPIIIILVGGSSWWLAGLAMRPIYLSYRQMQKFTADAAHELRTPLTAILATVESTLRMPSFTEQESRDTLRTVERQVSRFFELVKDLSLLSRLEQRTLNNQQSTLGLNDLVQDLVEEFSALAEANGLCLIAEVQTSRKLYIMADEDQIYRLVSNLIVNAIHYTPAAGYVKLVMKSEEQSAIIQIQDTGVGITLEDQKHIFDRFYRVNSDRSRQTGGSGLGLAIARAIAQAHHGSLQVESALGQGSIFILRLPLKSASNLLNNQSSQRTQLTENETLS